MQRSDLSRAKERDLSDRDNVAPSRRAGLRDDVNVRYFHVPRTIRTIKKYCSPEAALYWIPPSYGAAPNAQRPTMMLPKNARKWANKVGVQPFYIMSYHCIERNEKPSNVQGGQRQKREESRRNWTSYRVPLPARDRLSRRWRGRRWLLYLCHSARFILTSRWRRLRLHVNK